MLELLKRNAGKLRLLLGLSVCAFLFRFLDAAVVVKTLLQTHPSLYLAAFFSYACVVGFRAFRWQWLLKDLEIYSPLGSLIRIQLIGCYLNLFVPGGLAGDAYKIYDIKNTQAKSLRPLFATLIERIVGIGTLAGISFFSALIYGNQLPVSTGVLLLISGSLLGVSLLSLFLLPHTEKILKSFSLILPKKINSKIPWEKLSHLNNLSHELKSNTPLYIRTFLLSLMLQMCALMVYYLVAHSLDARISLWQVMVFFPLIDLTAMIPISVNGLGVKEALLVYFMKQNGIPPSFSMSLAILCRLIEISFALLGGILFLKKKIPS